ncbi:MULTISPECIES: hypothetical protein [unclassified Crossiella]|uniref:hypothetical protein n=1 Tax=unclassified Crossiella TaxID=2620835 RepID=UPI001FFF5B39|nr:MULTISPECIES: hypothetical protein [unclassified Crossiella]MCK2243788.1 hypothetical protein [Crossiella sp. S99.2]MCK2257647.1 hypothetical protein [Crossiella sp. S99.1]
MPASPHRQRPDACPGAIEVHPAADGGLARIRVPGGTLSAARLAVLRTAAMELGDGSLELTSRANVQLRGLAAGTEVELGARLAEAGLLPSLTHERMRNIVAAPLADNQDLVDAIDAALCARPELAGLPGRFLVVVDDGGVVSGLGGDIGLDLVGSSWALLLAGTDSGLRVSDPVDAVLRAALAFLAVRAEHGGTAWRLAEIDGGVAEITRRLGGPVSADRLAVRGSAPLPPGPLPDGRLVVGAPLGRLDPDQSGALLAVERVRLTPWRSVVLPRKITLGHGLITEPDSPWHAVTACTGRPGCAKSLADVRADAVRHLGLPGGPVHWSGCARRCGRPRGAIDVLATADGYLIDGQPHEDTAAAIDAARRTPQ